MASGRERSVSIFTLLHLVFHRRKPVEDGIKGKKKTGKKNILVFYSHVLQARTVLM